MAAEGSLLSRFFELRLTSYRRPTHAGATCVQLDKAENCQLAIVEFDDQGLCFAPGIMSDFAAALNALADKDPIIVVFAHGWKHNASESDSNLLEFTQLLRETTGFSDGRPVLGIYLSWRGLSRDGNWVWVQSSFWDRHDAAQRVAQGSVRELLGLLKVFRNRAPGGSSEPKATLLVIGHSFGGLLVYAALAQSLIEAAATQLRTGASIADLVLLVNPAFSAVSYMPIQQIVRHVSYPDDMLPIFVSVTAENDWATHYAYRLGMLTSLLTEACRTGEERQALINTMGHLPWMLTHALSASAATGDASTSSTGIGALSTSGAEASFGAVKVRRLPGAPSSPFWVASATPDVIDGHNGIFKPAFKDFVRALVAAHVTKRR